MQEAWFAQAAIQPKNILKMQQIHHKIQGLPQGFFSENKL